VKLNLWKFSNLLKKYFDIQDKAVSHNLQIDSQVRLLAQSSEITQQIDKNKWKKQFMVEYAWKKLLVKIRWWVDILHVKSWVLEKVIKAAMLAGLNILEISSWFRDKKHNKEVWGSNHSKHIEWLAVDIIVSWSEKYNLIKYAVAMWLNWVGVYSWWLHLDGREKLAYWWKCEQWYSLQCIKNPVKVKAAILEGRAMRWFVTS
jgi:hypothetical protein